MLSDSFDANAPLTTGPGRRYDVQVLDGTQWRGDGLNLEGVQRINSIYGTNRDFPVSTKMPHTCQAFDYSQAVVHAREGQPDGRCWLNFEKAQPQIREWTVEDWEIFSHHMKAEFERQLPNQTFKGQILYAATPSRGDWYTNQWEGTRSLRIPNLASAGLYTGRWQADRVGYMREAGAMGMDLAAFVGLENQITGGQCTMREWAEQIKICVALGVKYIIYWDNPVGHAKRASDSDWQFAHRIAQSFINPIGPAWDPLD